MGEHSGKGVTQSNVCNWNSIIYTT